jgi:hypothetical protein
MLFDRARLNAKQFGDVAGGLAARDPQKHLDLAGRQGKALGEIGGQAGVGKLDEGKYSAVVADGATVRKYNLAMSIGSFVDQLETLRA